MKKLATVAFAVASTICLAHPASAEIASFGLSDKQKAIEYITDTKRKEAEDIAKHRSAVAKLKLERKQIALKKAKEAEEAKRKKEALEAENTRYVEATFYGPDCYGCSGITATGDNVRKSIYVNGMRVIAVDPSVIPLRSIVHVTLSSGESFKAIAGDTGGRIKGNIIDVLVSSEKVSYNYGRQRAVVKILNN